MTTRLGRTLRTIRTDRGMTLSEVGCVTGIDRTLLSRLESGNRTTAQLITLQCYADRMRLKDTELVRLAIAAIRPHDPIDNRVRRTTE